MSDSRIQSQSYSSEEQLYTAADGLYTPALNESSELSTELLESESAIPDAAWQKFPAPDFSITSLFIANDDETMPPTVITQYLDRNINLLTVSNSNVDNIELAERTLTNIRSLQAELASSTSPENTQNILEELSRQLEVLKKCAVHLQKTHTRRGFNEYNTMERALDDIYRAARQATRDGGTQAIHLEATLLGLNLANVNKHDTSYRTGTLTIFLTAYFAEKRAAELGGKYYGVWGASSNTSIALGGLTAAQTTQLRDAVAIDVAEFYQHNRNFTRKNHAPQNEAEVFEERLLDHLNVNRISTTDFAGREYLKAGGVEALGMTAGHAFVDVSANEVLNERRGEHNVLLLLNLSSDYEKLAKNAPNRIAVQDSPKTQSDTVRPILSASLVTVAHSDSSGTLTPYPTVFPRDGTRSEGLENYQPTPIEARMPRPEHDAKRALIATEQAQAVVRNALS